MPMLNDAQAIDIVHENRESSPLGPGAGSDIGGLHLAVPLSAFVVTCALFGYAIAAGSAGDHAPIASATTAAKLSNFAPEAGWMNNLTVRLSVFGYESSYKTLRGSSQSVDFVPPGNLPRFVAAAMTDRGLPNIRLAGAMPTAGQNSKGQAALNSLSIEFPGNSAGIPAGSFGVITKVAEATKTLPAHMVVEVIGYTAGGRHSARGTALSRARANSVYRALVHAGINPEKLRPRGYGSASIEASGGTEGRSSMTRETSKRGDRRVEFRVVEPQR
jgi:outer membrane protein OmpA-like peptidoglycan-associated protein